MNKQFISIGVVSDVVCPWCYIGKRRLEKAMNSLSDKFDFKVEYFPFELNTQIPAEGVNQKQYLSDKFGGIDRYEKITAQTTAIAREEGLVFNFEKQKVSPNTRTAHRLIQLSKEENLQLQLIEAFFKAYFTDGLDLSKNETLISLATSVGMDREKVNAFLTSNTGVAEVEMAEAELHKLGITGVPFYIIDNKYGISGAQSPETFVKAFEEIASKMPTMADSGESCDADRKTC